MPATLDQPVTYEVTRVGEPLDEELVPPDSPLAEVISVNRARCAGQPCFAGTRLPIRFLFMYLRAADGGGGLSGFFEAYPDIDPAQVDRLLLLAEQGVLSFVSLQIAERVLRVGDQEAERSDATGAQR